MRRPPDTPALSLRFAQVARRLGAEATALGLSVPSFRSPPRTSGIDRSLRRRADGTVAVAVRLGGRPWVAVEADMIEGIVSANRLRGAPADHARRTFWAALEGDAEEEPEPPARGPRTTQSSDRHAVVRRLYPHAAA